MYLCKTLLAAIGLVCVSPVLTDDNQAWTALAVSGPVSENSRLLIRFDGHARDRDDASNIGVTILRPGLGWKAHEN